MELSNEETRAVVRTLLLQVVAVCFATSAMALTVMRGIAGHGASGRHIALGIAAVVCWAGVPMLLMLAGTVAARFASHRPLWFCVSTLPTVSIAFVVSAFG